MQGPIVECVPNFSEGRDAAAIAAITEAIAAVPGVSLLDVDPGEATNRTVVTLVGSPEAVVAGAFAGIAKAQQVIDMSGHSGAHPRMGATDVCPFVPVRDVTMDECAELARTLAARVAEELGIPVYLYEAAASRPERRNLATVRRGEYEGLADKLADPEWAPDFGAADYNDVVARSGATVIGARPFLIAWNINLNTREVRKAMKIAALLRERGILRRDGAGEIVRDAEGTALRDPGLFRTVKGIGWFIEEYDRCQVSLNLTDYTVAPMHEVYDAARRIADEEGVVVTGSELVGLVPLDAMLRAGRHYLRRQGLAAGAPDDDLVEVAVRSLGLSELAPFDPAARVVERRIGSDGVLVAKTVRDFSDTLSSSAPAPGGGSVAALCGSMAAALSSMVGSLTTGKKGYEDRWEESDAMSVRAQALREAFLADVDADTAAFDEVMEAMKLPKKTPEDKRARRRAIAMATRGATEVPLRVLERNLAVLDCVDVALVGNANARSDAGVAALCARACAEGAWYNVMINVSGLKRPEVVKGYTDRANAALDTVISRTDAIASRVRAELAG